MTIDRFSENAYSRQPRIWMNVTTTHSWDRPAVGIVRVEQKLAADLRRLYGKRFSTCIIEDGVLVPVRRLNPSEVGSGPQLFWPDRSRTDNRSENGMGHVAVTVNDKAFLSDDRDEKISFGDVVISVGLDWDHNTGVIFSKLKQKMGIKFVTCCYDLIPVLYPHYCVGEVAARFKEYFTGMAWSSDLILCISRKTESDYLALSERLGFPSVPTIVMELGDNVIAGNNAIVPSSLAYQRLNGKSFILYVSTIERRKNHDVLYRALCILSEEGRIEDMPELVFVGMQGWGVSDLLKDIELTPIVREKIIQFNHVTDSELGWLYQNSKFVVFPSFYEGWDLPVGEALALGKAVLASDRGAIAEVGGDLVVYADPWSAHEWAKKMYRLSTDRDYLENLEHNVRENYSPRLWSRAAQTVKDGVDKIAHSTSDFVASLYPGYDMSTNVGTAHVGSIKSTGIEGVLAFGPYRVLPAGRYILSIEFEKLANSSGKLHFCVCGDAASKVFTTFDLYLENAQSGDMNVSFAEFAVDQAVLDYEVVIMCSQGLYVSLNKVVLTAVGLLA